MVWGKYQKCKLYLCTMQSFFSSGCFFNFKSSVNELVYKRSRKTKLGNLSKIIHQKLPILDRNLFIKAQKNSLIFKFLEQKEFFCRLKTELSHSCTRFARRKHLMAFDAWKNLQWKLVLNFIVAKSLKKIFLKFLLCITNLEELVQTILLLFWSVSECRVPLFNQLIQPLA